MSNDHLGSVGRGYGTSKCQGEKRLVFFGVFCVIYLYVYTVLYIYIIYIYIQIQYTYTYTYRYMYSIYIVSFSKNSLLFYIHISLCILLH